MAEREWKDIAERLTLERDELRAENDRLTAELDDARADLDGVVEQRDAARARLEAVRADGIWMARLARGSSWPGEMAHRVDESAAKVLALLGPPPP